MSAKDLQNRFTHHPPTTETIILRYQGIRQTLLEAALYIENATPASREQSLAITKLEEAMFWANAAIARNEKP